MVNSVECFDKFHFLFCLPLESYFLVSLTSASSCTGDVTITNRPKKRVKPPLYQRRKLLRSQDLKGVCAPNVQLFRFCFLSESATKPEYFGECRNGSSFLSFSLLIIALSGLSFPFVF